MTDAYTRTQFAAFHYPEEWGPSDARRLACVCGNPDPFHADPPQPEATPVEACQWSQVPRSNTFRVKKEDPKDEHSPWWLVMPGNYMLAFNHNEDDKIDEARANWVAHTLNAALTPGNEPLPGECEMVINLLLAGGHVKREKVEEAARIAVGTLRAGAGERPSEPPFNASNWLTNGGELHPLTTNLVVRFARALAAKLAAAEVKYGYSDGWRGTAWMDECRAKLMEHIGKGDPRDVAAYCAFLWHHGESTAGAVAVPAVREPSENQP